MVLLPDPDFTVIAVSKAYAKATLIDPGKAIGLGLFKLFPDNPDDPKASGVANLRTSLQNVVAEKRKDTMAVQRYDVRKAGSDGGELEERFWSPVNNPVFDAKGNLAYIIH